MFVTEGTPPPFVCLRLEWGATHHLQLGLRLLCVVEVDVGLCIKALKMLAVDTPARIQHSSLA